ncbi:hypothetical protein ACFLT7_05300 [candidate division KSB1 bacterium]
MFAQKLFGPLIAIAFLLSLSSDSEAKMDRFTPRYGDETEVWRLTDDPTWRHTANYHNVNCFSPDGRYICYNRYHPYQDNPQSITYIYDLQEDREIRVDNGDNPRWTNTRNRLLYIRKIPGGSELRWFDPESGENTLIAPNVDGIGTPDFLDRWIYGYATSADGTRTGVRVPIRPDSRPEIIPINGYQWVANPAHPVVFARIANSGIPFLATRYWVDLDGGNRRIGSPVLQQCHQSWSGDGTWYMFGNSQMRGRRWDEPFPSNIHYIAAVDCPDISPCGKSGRFITASGADGPLELADLRSGDGRVYLKAALSRIHDSTLFSYCFGSGLTDNDGKGSPDGTKVPIVTNYDLKDGPVTTTTASTPGVGRGGDVIRVESTDGFPAKGRLSIRMEVIGYNKKTATTFEGLTRQMYHTTPHYLENLNSEMVKRYEERPDDIPPGRIVSSFDHRLLPEDFIKKSEPPDMFQKPDFTGDRKSPLLWQRQTDLHVVVARLPDRPWLWTVNGRIELVPGESHWETFGYNVFRNGKKINKYPLRPGTDLKLSGPGSYTASAVEYSGLESEPSAPLEIERAGALRIRTDKPADFHWTSDRWSVGGEQVDKAAADKSPGAIKEIVHRYDGVIHREWYIWGVLTQRHDLNKDGKAIRRLFYRDGRLARREYHKKDGFHSSTELFDAEGWITESILYRRIDGKQTEYSHWWYDKGMPEKYIGRRRHHTASPDGPGVYAREGNNWVRKSGL